MQGLLVTMWAALYSHSHVSTSKALDHRIGCMGHQQRGHAVHDDSSSCWPKCHTYQPLIALTKYWRGSTFTFLDDWANRQSGDAASAVHAHPFDYMYMALLSDRCIGWWRLFAHVCWDALNVPKGCLVATLSGTYSGWCPRSGTLCCSSESRWCRVCGSCDGMGATVV
jgi:hypothetical protein